MAGADLRPAFAVFLGTFGVPAVVTRPAPDDDPIETEVIWLPPLPTDVPFGMQAQRQEPKKVMGIPKTAVPTVPRKTVIDAPDVLGGASVRWRVDGFDQVDVDHTRVVVVPDLEP